MTAAGQHKMGTDGWIEHVYRSPPVDKLKGRSRYTQTHQPWHEMYERYAPVQGRKELHAFLALRYLSTLGLVTRFKEHPFETKEQEFGRCIKPDFIAEVSSAWRRGPCNVVLEIKSARFVTEVVALELRTNAARFSEFGLEYQVWKDSHPLGYGVRHNLINMHRANGEEIALDELHGLKTLVADRGRVTVREAVSAGFDQDCIYAAAWRGLIHFPLDVCLGVGTELTQHAQRDYSRVFLDNRPIGDTWWDSLATV